MRRIVIVVIVLLALAFVLFSLTELENILEVLKESNVIFLLVAVLVEMICLLNTTATFGALYRLVGLTESGRRMFLMTTAANFVNMVAPSGGLGGIAVFLDEARRRRLSTARVMVVGVLYLLYEYAALFCILTLGFIVLIRRESINIGELIAAGFLLVLVSSIASILLLGYRSPDRLGKFLAGLSSLLNRLLKPLLRRDILVIENAYKFSHEISEGIASIRGSKKNLILPFLFTLNNKILLMFILTCTFLALNTPFSAGTIVGGFSISYLFFYASPTPSGVGFVEGILPAALNSLSVPFTEAVLITLVFRAVTLWLPLAAGAVAFHILQTQSKSVNNSS
jgi:glycosyltransferase 2 family protein